MKTKKKKVVIQRSKWQCGGEEKVAEKFPEEEAMVSLWGVRTNSGCCLGHILHQAHDVSYDSMTGKADPEELARYNITTPLVSKDAIENNEFAQRAMKINDDHTISDKMREYKLRRLGKKYGYELEFTD